MFRYFVARTTHDQLLHIMRIIGTPDEENARKVAAEAVRSTSSSLFASSCSPARDHSQAIPRYPKVPFSDVLPKATPQGNCNQDSVTLAYS